MAYIPIINALLQHSSANGSRSTALKPLGWLVALLLSGTLASIYLESPLWLIQMLSVFSGLSVILYFFAYIFFMCKDPDALRSEKFNIEKMAIQKGLIGDSQTGVIEAESVQSPQLQSSGQGQLGEMK